MTMKREAKSDHQFELHIAKTNSGFTTAEWSSPRGRAAAVAATGHTMMTAGDYRTHYMGRKVTSKDRRDVAVERVKARRGRH